MLFYFCIFIRDFEPGQQCCYGSDGNIITGSNGGTADLVAPTNWKTTLVHFREDVVPWFWCCSCIAEPLRACHRYTSVRPVDDCSDWPERPPPGKFKQISAKLASTLSVFHSA